MSTTDPATFTITFANDGNSLGPRRVLEALRYSHIKYATRAADGSPEFDPFLYELAFVGTDQIALAPIHEDGTHSTFDMIEVTYRELAAVTIAAVGQPYANTLKELVA